MNATEALQAILSESDAKTLADLSRTLYKYTDAGVSLAARLDNGACLWNGNEAQRSLHLLPRVRALGISSIVEGSDAEVPLVWLELDTCADAADAIARFDKIVEEVDDEACRLWDEAHTEEEGEAS